MGAHSNSSGKKSAWSGGLWVENGWALYSGPAGDTTPHAHHAIQVAVGIDGSFGIEVGDAGAQRPDGIVIGSGAGHRLNAGGADMLMLYVEPVSDLGRGIGAWLSGDQTKHLAERHIHGVRKTWRDRSDDTAFEVTARQIRDACFDAFLPEQRRNDGGSDLRVLKAIDVMKASLDGKISAATVAREAGISPSRLSALFRRDLGISIRAYVLWLRLQAALGAIAAGDSATEAAHAAGFADSAHFSRTMRRMFGISPSALSGRWRG